MRKKKSILAVMLTIMILLVTAIAGVKAQWINDTDAVKNIINKYFTNEFESIKTQKVVDSKDIIMDNEFRNYTNLKNKHIAEWYSKVNEKLISYNFVVNYKSIDFNSDECIVTLTRDSEMTFDYAPDISQKTANVEYIVYLKKYDNKWYIEKVVNEEDGTPNKNEIKKKDYIKNKYDLLNENYKNIDKRANEYKEFKKEVKEASSQYMVSILGGDPGAGNVYNRQAAVSYARDWALARNTSKYPSYSEDCTNFVSQCVYAGAPVMNPARGWYASMSGGGLAWIQVLTFHDFITTNSPNVGPWAYTVSKSSAQIGDVIQLWKISAGKYNHSIIISSILSDGTILYCGHTTDRLDASLSEVYASRLYDINKTRFIHIYEYGK